MASYLSVLIQAAEPANYKLNYDEHYMISVPLATTTTPGIAAFDSDYFVIEDGVVKINPEYEGELENKVDKIVPEDAGIFAYVVRKVMGQVINYAIEISQDADADTIAMRYTDGRLKVGDGVDNVDAVNKKQLTNATTDIPKSALAASVQASLGKADTAVQAPVPKTDLASAVQTSLGKADTAVQAPIPETDLSTDVRTKLNKVISRVGISPGDWAALPDADKDINTMYFVGPYGTSPNQYFVEYMYFIDTNDQGHWEAIGSTQAVDLSNYFTKSEITAMLTDYAKQNGNYPTMSVGHADIADNLSPYSDESGTTQDAPFISQGTGTANNTSSVDTGAIAKVLVKQGNTMVRNQYVKEGNFLSRSVNGLTSSVSEHKLVLSGTAIADSTSQSLLNVFKFDNQFVAGHKVLTYNLPEGSSNTFWYKFYGFTSTEFYGGYEIHTTKADDNVTVGIGYKTGAVLSASVFPQFVDLTQYFGSNSNIPQDLLDNPDHWSWYENSDGEYDAGSLANTNGRYLVCMGRNLFDKATAVTGYIDDTNGCLMSSATSKATDYIMAIPNRQFHIKTSQSSGSWGAWYDKDKNYISRIINYIANPVVTAPANARYMRLTISYTGSGDVDTFGVSLYYPPEEGGEGYSYDYPYEKPKVYDTGTELLRSAGSVKDTKLPSGVITGNIGTVDLGTLNYTRFESETPGVYGFVTDTDSIPIKAFNSRVCNLSCSNGFVPVASSTIYYGTASDKTIGAWDGAGVRIRDDSYSDAATFKAAMSGVMLYYELATPTTEQGTTFPDYIDINDYGMMYWLDTDGNLVGIPQGIRLFYPVDYKAFLDTLNGYTEGDPENIALKGELASGDPNTLKGAIDAYNALYAIMQENVGGALRHQLVAKVVAGGGTLAYKNTACVDLGTLNPSYNSGWNCWTFSVSGMKPATGNSSPANVLCAICTTVAASGYTSSHESFTVAINTNGSGFIDNGSSTIPPKGVLLAYEKVST